MNRKNFLKKSAGVLTAITVPSLLYHSALSADSSTKNEKGETSAGIRRRIPSSGEMIGSVGLGTWQTFDKGWGEYDTLAEVLTTLEKYGGSVIDTSPMYGRAEKVIGRLTRGKNFFFATKVYTDGKENGEKQIRESMAKMRTDQLDLLQVHNLRDYSTHIKTLKKLKEEQKVRYIGITHYLTSYFPEIISILRKEKLDFVQIPFSPGVPDAADKILPIARERGTAVLINRPFEGGNLFLQSAGRELPGFASELKAVSYAQLYLKYILSYDDVTCVIPGTSNPLHMRENILAARGPLPDKSLRRRIENLFR